MTGASAGDRVLEGKDRLVRVVTMLSKLVQRYAHAARTREGGGEYDIGGAVAGEDDGEDDDEDEDEDGGEGEDEGEDEDEDDEDGEDDEDE